MNDQIKEFQHDLFQEILGGADARGKFLEEEFLSHFTDHLIDAGEFDTFDPAYYPPKRGMRVDGYAGDPEENDGILTLFVADFHTQEEAGTLTRTEAETFFRRLARFYEAALKPAFHQELEETTEGFGLAEMIHARHSRISRIRMFLLSNHILSARVSGLPEGRIQDIPVTYNIWDVSRLYRLVSSRKGREDIRIDLLEEFGEGLPCLPASVGEDAYQAYLVVVPARILSDLYDRWGARLLEQNVRCFLQGRGKVNKGIRNTILNEAGMFFAYNNGITATAESIETSSNGGAASIVGLRNLQIVNGGQTTASLFSAAKKDRADLNHIFVQMKLSVVSPERAMEMVPNISRYANTQNRINAADFFANHPFHIRMEEISRRLWAPSPDSSYHESKWFYERARGQYLDAKAHLTTAQKKKFERDFPRSQCFTKTDLAKFENVWERIPHIVSKGAQFNFADYAGRIGQRWEKNPHQFNEMYFRHVVAKAIIFRKLEKIVMDQPWYNGGYRANIVAYTLSKLADLVQERGRVMDFDDVWKRQDLSPALRETLIATSAAVHEVIVNPDSGIQNITEWAKKQACWQRVQALTVTLPAAFLEEMLDPSEEKTIQREAQQVQKIDNGIDAQKKVLELGAAFWRASLEWDRSRRVLTEKDHQIMAVAAAIPVKLPTEKQSLHLIGVLERLREEACPLAQDV